MSDEKYNIVRDMNFKTIFLNAHTWCRELKNDKNEKHLKWLEDRIFWFLDHCIFDNGGVCGVPIKYYQDPETGFIASNVYWFQDGEKKLSDLVEMKV